MKLVSEAFDKLSSVVPVYKMMTSTAAPMPLAAAVENSENKNPVTKVSTLRCAIAYINSLQRLIEDANRGVLDPSLYTIEDEEDAMDMPKAASTASVTSKKAKKKDKGRGKKASEKAKKAGTNKHAFKVRQYHAADFSRGGHVTKASKKAKAALPTKIMSKAQLNLAIAKGLQNCKPIYAPPPPASKKQPQQPPMFASNNLQGPLQIIQLRPLNFSSTITDAEETASEAGSTDYLMPGLEVFLQNQQPSPSTSTNSSLMASSPLSSSSSSNSESCFTTILEEAHILDDIQAVLMDADNFDILV